MVDVVTALGGEIARSTERIEITGIGGVLPDHGAIFARRSGTTARFVASILAVAPGPWTLDGDDQLARRPMEDLYRSLESIGVRVERRIGDRSLPVVIRG